MLSGASYNRTRALDTTLKGVSQEEGRRVWGRQGSRGWSSRVKDVKWQQVASRMEQ